MTKQLLLLAVIFLALVQTGLAQEGGALDREAWEESRESLDYTENLKRPEPAEPKDKMFEDIDVPEVPVDPTWWKYGLNIVMILIVVAFVVMLIINRNANLKIDRKLVKASEVEDLEDKIHEVDMDAMLAEAIQTKNYRYALRVNFLIIIKELSQKKFINWAKKKTNWQYHAEIKSLASEFEVIILNFERVWYGEQPIDEETYKVYDANHQSFKKKLNE